MSEKKHDDVIEVEARFFGKTSEEVFPIGDIVSFIQKHLPDNLRTQIEREVSVFNLESDIIDPPYNPLTLSMLLEFNTRLAEAIDLKARQSVGLGYDVEHRRRKLRGKDKATLELAEEQKQALLEKLDYISDIPFSELLYRVKKDEEITGNGYIVVMRSIIGEINYITNLPSHTVRITKSGLYVHMRNGSKKYYKPFGDRRIIDSRTGKEADRSLPFSLRAGEIIHFKNYSSRSSFYGVPKWIPAIAAVVSNRLIAEKILAVFKNTADPRFLIFVQNGRVEDKVIQRLRMFFDDELAGTENAGRVVVLQSSHRNPLDGNKTKFELHSISFADFLKNFAHLDIKRQNDEEVREALGVAQAYFTSENVNRASAREAKQMTVENALLPSNMLYEHILNRTIVADMGFDLVKLVLTKPSVQDAEEQSLIDERYLNGGVKSINEVRESLGLAPFPKEMVFARLPWVVAEKFLEFGMISQPIITKEDKKSMPQQQPEIVSPFEDNPMQDTQPEQGQDVQTPQDQIPAESQTPNDTTTQDPLSSLGIKEENLLAIELQTVLRKTADRLVNASSGSKDNVSNETDTGQDTEGI